MENLNSKEMKCILSLIQVIYSLQPFSSLQQKVRERLYDLIQHEVATWTSTDVKCGKVFFDIMPKEFQVLYNLWRDDDISRIYHLQNPCSRAISLSDLVSKSQLQKTGLYNEVMRPNSIEYVMTGRVFSDREKELVWILKVVKSSHKRDFSSKEKFILDILQSHINQACRNSLYFEDLAKSVASFRPIGEQIPCGVIVVDSEGRAFFMNKLAEGYLQSYFWSDLKKGPYSTCGLPGEIKLLIEGFREENLSFSFFPRPLEKGEEGKKLRVQVSVLPQEEANPSGGFMILLEESPEMESHGLSEREIEVLEWVTQGKTNKQIAEILGISPLTVKTHLEHIYAKLGVWNRTEATTLALKLNLIGSK